MGKVLCKLWSSVSPWLLSLVKETAHDQVHSHTVPQLPPSGTFSPAPNVFCDTFLLRMECHFLSDSYTLWRDLPQS
jgi:hypothetical protein